MFSMLGYSLLEPICSSIVSHKTAIGTVSGDYVHERLSLSCINRMATHLNQVDSDLPKEVVFTELNEPISGCRLKSVSYTHIYMLY